MDDNFDAKEWVNTAFRSQKDPSAAKDVSRSNTIVFKINEYQCTFNSALYISNNMFCGLSFQQYATTLVMKLQMFIQVFCFHVPKEVNLNITI